ncbi:MAG: COX15/CtaA family protein [Pseudomonadota bacterium]
MRYLNVVRLMLVMTLVVIILGAYTRLADAGLGCPDWPGCYGQWLVPETPAEVENKDYLAQRPLEVGKGWLEMIHRYFAGMLGLLIAGLAAWSWQRRFRQIPQQPVWLPTALLGLVIVQAMLGMWTVTLLLKPVIVMMHLLGGFTLFALLFILMLRLQSAHPSVADADRLRWAARIGLVLLVVQIALGGWTSTNYAALACTDLPTCQGVWWPQMDFAEGFTLWRGIGTNYEYGVLDHPARVAIHMVHRLGAIVVSIWLAGLVYALVRHSQVLGTMGMRMGALLILQVVLGLSNVLFHLPLWVATAHNATAALLLLAVVQINFTLRRT